MFAYPLRALSKDGKEVISFSIDDGPCQLEENLFVLTARVGTPILRYDSVLRGMDIPNIFEGDIIDYKGKEFVIQYQRGFAAVSDDKDIVLLDEISDIRIVSNIYKSCKFSIPKLSRLTYKFQDILFTLNNVIGVYGSSIVLNIKDGVLVPFEDIQQYAGITYDKKTLYFGDTISQSLVVLNKGRCSVFSERSQKYIDLTKGDIVLC